MAVVKFGPTVSSVRGAIGACTFSTNKTGPFLAYTQRPTKHYSPRLLEHHARLRRAQLLWPTLSTDQRIAWNAFATDPPETDTDPWGDPAIRAGVSWCLRINARRFLLGQTPLLDPPTSTPTTPPVALSATIRPYGLPDSASFLTFSTDVPNPILNPGLEPPYTAGLAKDWKVTAALAPYCSQESVDVYAGTASQRAANPGTIAAVRLYTTNFTIIPYTRHFIYYATKIISGKISRIYLNRIGIGDLTIASDLTNPDWLLRTYTYDNTTATAANLAPWNATNTAGTWLLDHVACIPTHYAILLASVVTSPGITTATRNYKLIWAGYPSTLNTIYIGDALTASFGELRPTWAVHLRLQRQSLTAIRSTTATLKTIVADS